MELFQVLGKKVVTDFRDFSEYYVPKAVEFFDVSEFSGSWDDWEYRSPSRVADVASWDTEVNNWHQDNEGKSPGLILWTNVYPTEVMLPDGSIVSGEPYDVVLIDNRIVRHRTPEAFRYQVKQGTAPTRHFIRSGLQYEPSNKVIANWKKLLAS